MSYTHSFVGYTPPVRYDAEPWASVRIEESATETGSYTAIETIAISPVDSDPSQPASRNFTTNDATLESGWYRLVFIDGDGGQAPASDPVEAPSTSQYPDVRTKLALMILADQDPILSDDHLDDILTYARRPDATGYVYDDDSWTPTWDLDAAAAEGWRRKAGVAAARFNFAEDGQRFDRAQVYAHCLSQAEQFARRAMGSIPMGDALAS